MAKSDKVRLIDVAQRCNLHKSTVSLILNNRLRDFPVRAETVELVRKTAQEMGYVPNRFAQTLVTKRTRLIGYSFPYSNPKLSKMTPEQAISSLDPELMGGMVAAATEHAYEVVCLPRDEHEKKLPIGALSPEIIDGLLWVNPSQHHREYLEVHKKRGNVVLLGNCGAESGVPMSDVDNEHESYRLAQYMIANGAQKIAFFCDAYPTFEVGRVRYEAFRRAMEEAGLKCPKAYMCAGSLDFECEFDKLKQLLEGPNQVDALFVSGARRFVDIYQLLHERGLDLMKDLHVGCFLSASEFGYARPDLTVVEFDKFRMGYESALGLINLLEGRPTQEPFHRIPCRLRPRGGLSPE